jgi:hypothetical protein
MRRPVVRGLLVAALHIVIVASLGAKLLIDRSTRPRVWARTAPVDPDLPIRGRYVQLALEASPGAGLALPPASEPAAATRFSADMMAVDLIVRDGRLEAVPSERSDSLRARPGRRGGTSVVVLDQPLAFFIPEHVADPSRRAADEELWVEVTLPKAGLPRPIRLGVKKGGVLTPLD